jgi:hypothetical protein
VLLAVLRALFTTELNPSVVSVSDLNASVTYFKNFLATLDDGDFISSLLFFIPVEIHPTTLEPTFSKSPDFDSNPFCTDFREVLPKALNALFISLTFLSSPPLTPFRELMKSDNCLAIVPALDVSAPFIVVEKLTKLSPNDTRFFPNFFKLSLFPPKSMLLADVASGRSSFNFATDVAAADVAVIVEVSIPDTVLEYLANDLPNETILLPKVPKS